MDSDRDIYFKNSREMDNESSQYRMRWVMALLEGIPNISDWKKSTKDLISQLEEVLSVDPKDHDTLWCLGNANAAYTFSIPEPNLAEDPFHKASVYFQKAVEKDPTNELYRKSLRMNNEELPKLHMLFHTYSPDQKLMPEHVILFKKSREMAGVDDQNDWAREWVSWLEWLAKRSNPKTVLADIISKLEESLLVDPNNHDTLWCLGNAHVCETLATCNPDLATFSFRTASIYFQRAVEKDPTNELYRTSLRMTNEQLPNFHMCLNTYSSDQKMTPEHVILFKQTREMVGVDDAEGCSTVFMNEIHKHGLGQQLAVGGPSGSSNPMDRDRGFDQLDSSVELAEISFSIDRNEIPVAQKSLEALLEKYPKCFAALALKARVSGVLKENALGVCQQLVKLVDSCDEEELTDDALRSMEAACLSINQLKLASDCYKDSYSNAEKDMFLRTRFLMGRIRCCYFMEQFEELRKLTHLLAENLVSAERDPEEVEIANIWLCCAYQLEAYAPYTTNRNDLLQLAAVSVKLISAQGFITKGGLIMAISLFENCSMHANALAAIEKSPNKQLVCDGDVLLIKGRIQLKECQYNAACDTFKQVLKTCSADWTCFMYYLDSLLEGKKSSLSSKEVDSRLSIALNLASQIVKESHSDPIFEYRATLEIERRKHLFGNEADLVGALREYFTRVGHLNGFIVDVTTALEALSFPGEDGRVQMNQMLKHMYNTFRPLENRPSGTLAREAIRPANLRDLGKLINMHKLQLRLQLQSQQADDEESVSLTNAQIKVLEKIMKLEQALKGSEFDEEVSDLEMRVRKFVADYYRHLHLSKNIDVEEPIFGEELLSITFDSLVQIYWRTKESSCLMEAIEILEFGLTIQKYSHEYSILLIHMYSYVGAYELAYNHYETLQITNPLLLGECLHNILPLMLKSPFSARIKEIINDYIIRMEDSMKESINRTYIGFARTTEVQQAIEAYMFINRMKNSHQFVSAKFEDSIMELSQNRELLAENFGENFLLDEEKLKSLTFSEDLSLRPWWTSLPAIDYLLGEKTRSKVENTLEEDESRKVLQRRSLIPRLMSLSVQAANESLAEKSELKKYLQTYARSFAKSLEQAYGFISSAAEGQPLRKNPWPVSETLDWVNFAVFLFAWSFCNESDFGKNGLCKGCDLWYIVVELVGRLTNHSLELQEPRLTILNGIIQMVREPVSWYILIVEARLRWLQSTPPGASSSQKKKHRRKVLKKRKILGGSIKSLRGSLKSITAWLDKLCNTLDSDDLMAAYQKKYYDSIDLDSSADLGDRITKAVQSWDRSTVPRNVLRAQLATLVEFSKMCEQLLKETEELLKEAGMDEDNG